MSKKTEIQISLEDMMEIRDGSAGASDSKRNWGVFTVAIGLAERLERIIELLEKET